MPRMALPPTPGPSSDIKGQAKLLLPLQMTFELPPPAISGSPGVPSSTLVASRTASDSSAYPMQASEIVKSRRRASAAQPRSQFTLPPPPTRQRKIIQMKPRKSLPTPSPAESPVVAANKAAAAAAASRTKNAPDSNRNDVAVSSSSFASSSIKTATPAAAAAETGLAAAAASAAAATTTTSTSSSTSGTKRKQASSSTAAGRKIARKTAHSEIERRRRSKMNEGFALLKSMIPACTDEMHKLSILQASIDYIRYLEDCNSKLKTRVSADAESRSSLATPRGLRTPSGREPYQISRSYPPFAPSRQADNDVDMENVDNDDEVDMTQNRIDEDEEGDEDEQVSPRSTSLTPGLPSHGQSRLPSISPALLAADSHHRKGSYSSVAYSYGASSATASPAVGPRTYGGSGGAWRSSNSTADSALPSPALLPMRDHDQEATAGLLMLVASAPPVTGRGMSVSDLLIK